VPNTIAESAGAASGEMSINNGGDDGVQASSDSFWEVGKYMRTVSRIENGNKLCTQLKQLINSRAEIERSYAKQLTGWSKKWNEFLDKGPEYGTTQAAWRGVLEEADKLSDMHNEVGDKLVNNVTASIKLWQKENYHKTLMHLKEPKEMEDQFRKVQRPWEKKFNKVQAAKKEYHNACKNEKSTANQENNARADTAMSTDQLKKMQEKLKKCQADVESTHDKYNACLNDLNAYNPKYIEDMSEVFDKCQAFEKKRIEFVRKIMFDIHECLDLSEDLRYKQIYVDLTATILATEAEKDLKWWSNNHGAGMAMAWPAFEEYSPDLKPIHGKEKKSSQIGTGEAGITITSIKHSQDNFVPQASTTTTPPTNNRDSRHSQHSQSSHQGYNNTAADPVPPPPAQSSAPSSGKNPFGELDSDEDHVSQGSGTGSVAQAVHVQARVLYTYKAEEEDEISAEAGEILTRCSDQDDMGWVKVVMKSGKEGLIPFSYIEDMC